MHAPHERHQVSVGDRPQQRPQRQHRWVLVHERLSPTLIDTSVFAARIESGEDGAQQRCAEGRAGRYVSPEGRADREEGLYM